MKVFAELFSKSDRKSSYLDASSIATATATVILSFSECIISRFNVFANGLLEKFTIRLQLIEDYKLVCLVIRNNILCRRIN